MRSPSLDYNAQMARLIRKCWERTGLTQPEVAAKAECSEQYFRQLLKGRERAYSSALLDRIADAISMSDGERALLHASAGQARAMLTAFSDNDIDDIAEEMELSPFPAMLFDIDFTVVRANATALLWL
jgi:transcriptional regulator with XRE-family HTH domain